jgi:hypothetical protein
MKTLLMKHRPPETSKEEWVKSWENAGWTLSALFKSVQELESSTEIVKEEDFSVANHYALLAFQAGKRAAYREIIELLPKTSKE